MRRIEAELDVSLWVDTTITVVVDVESDADEEEVRQALLEEADDVASYQSYIMPEAVGLMDRRGKPCVHAIDIVSDDEDEEEEDEDY